MHYRYNTRKTKCWIFFFFFSKFRFSRMVSVEMSPRDVVAQLRRGRELRQTGCQTRALWYGYRDGPKIAGSRIIQEREMVTVIELSRPIPYDKRRTAFRKVRRENCYPRDVNGVWNYNFRQTSEESPGRKSALWVIRRISGTSVFDW